MSCVLYLASSLDLVDPRIEDSQSSTAVELCLHGLQLYANDHWLDHILALGDQEMCSLIRDQDLRPLRHSLEQLTTKHNELACLFGFSAEEEHSTVARLEDSHWDFLTLSPNARTLLTMVFSEASACRKGISTKGGQFL